MLQVEVLKLQLFGTENLQAKINQTIFYKMHFSIQPWAPL